MNISRDNENEVFIRRADLSDITDLLKICRKCFLRIRWWGLPRYTRSWWQAAITSEAADVYVAQYEDIVVAFAVLVKDEELWRRERKSRKGSFMSHFLSCIVCPVLTVRALWKRIVRLISKNERIPVPSIKMSYNRTWLEMLAVLPRKQGCGIARRLLSECELRTKAINRDAIGLMVSRSSKRAIRLYKKIGYKKTADSSDGEFYIKVLNSGCLADRLSD